MSNYTWSESDSALIHGYVRTTIQGDAYTLAIGAALRDSRLLESHNARAIRSKFRAVWNKLRSKENV